MLPVEYPGSCHLFSVGQSVPQSIPFPASVPAHDRRVHRFCYCATSIFHLHPGCMFRMGPNRFHNTFYFLLLVAGWVLGFPEKCSSKISYPRPQRFLNYHIKGNCRSTSSISCLMILYCSGKWISAACR